MLNLPSIKSNSASIRARYAALEERSQRVNQVLFESRLGQAEVAELIRDTEAMLERVHRANGAAEYLSKRETTRPEARV